MIGAKPDRLAMVASSTLGKLQGQRADVASARFFSTLEEAEAWLLEAI